MSNLRTMKHTRQEKYDVLKIGEVSSNGQVTIIDKDRICYLVKNISHGSSGIRTISKKLVGEYIDYLSLHPNATSNEVREALCGNSELDKFEYGYTSTLTIMAKMCMEHSKNCISANSSLSPLSSSPDSLQLQQIFYGVPGTGKSFTIWQETKGEDVVRTTFHPDSDYSTFVGAYKPTTKSVKLRDMAGHVVKDEETNKPVEEDRIVYEFVEQAFLKAYVKAWKNYAKHECDGAPKKEYLVIEEINRGNCAQIFGDLFQLLDRNAAGFSDYPIQADKDMQKQLQKAFCGFSIAQAERINDLYDGKDVVAQVVNGDILLLPNNLYIWATMNTSDQSLFPIDSAFKRRWDWTYVPIADAQKDWCIEVGNVRYDWWQFLEKINHKIGETTNSEDKKLGYFFCKANDENVITAEKFVGKVIFYLWNDVFKDYEFDDAIFKDEDGTKLTFDKFHMAVGRKSEIVESKVQLFLKNLGLEPIAFVDEGIDDAEDTAIPEIKSMRREYWDAFLRYAEGNEDFVKSFGEGRTAGASHSTDFSINHPDCHLVITQARQKKALSVSLYFNQTTKNYYRLQEKKNEIEQELQIKFEWNEMPDNKASIIRETKLDVDFDNHDKWPEQFSFIIDRLLRMRTTFLKYLA